MVDHQSLFVPERIAVIGATDREGSVGRALMENLASFGGEVLPINPSRETVLDMVCFDDIESVPDPAGVDLAVVLVPPESAVAVVETLGTIGIDSVVVITAGFRERGEGGEALEARLVDIAQQYDIDLVGPNSVGIMNTAIGLNATFLDQSPPAGSLSLMSQSGAVISAVLGWARARGVGFRDIVSLGNEAVLGEVEFLEVWGDDPETDAIVAYLEDIEEGRRFVEMAREVTPETPVIALKSGRTETGAEAAASHTGSIAGSDHAYNAGFDAGGVIRASGIEELFDVGRVLVGQEPPSGDSVAIVTNGGGPGVLAADALEEAGLSVASLEGLHGELRDVLPSQAEVDNPLDIIGDADIDRFRAVLDVVMGAETVDAVVVISIPTALFPFEDLASVVGELQERHDIVVVTALMSPREEIDIQLMAEFGIPNYFEPARAVRSLETLAEYGTITDSVRASPPAYDADYDRVEEILGLGDRTETERLSVESMDLLEAYGIPSPAGDMATDAEEALAIADELAGPVVMKLASPDIVHKSDIGGVEIGVPVEEVSQTFEGIIRAARNHDADATIHGVRVEEVVDLDDSVETIVGVTRDRQFGHLVMFGFGGIFVEVFEDTAFRLAPVTEDEARAMTADIESAPILRGARGRTPSDIDGIVEVICRVSQLVTDYPAIRELDINPLVVGADGVKAVDFQATVDPEAIPPNPD